MTDAKLIAFPAECRMPDELQKSLPHSMGKVYLIGAGPGDPGLITLRGIECLKRADVVLYDYLVNPVIAEHAADSAETICLGRHGGRQRIWSQDEINEKLVSFARSGRVVARLKGGDPAVFARGGEEAAYLIEHGVPLEVVPGITVALAAGSHAGIPITHRDLASAVALVTGREKPGKSESSLDFEALARFPGTLVFYMGVTTAKEWTAKLMKHGKPPSTPVALVRRCSLPDQQLVRCRLDEVVDRLTPYSRFPPPVVSIVGDVTHPDVALDWFEQRPLFGQSILVTRPASQAGGFGRMFTDLGAQVFYQPAIAISPIEDWSAVDNAIERLDAFDSIVFSSANGVDAFLGRLLAENRDLRCLAGKQLAAVGPATADALGRYWLKADVVPEEFRAESLAETLVQSMGAGCRKFLLIRASRGREILATTLQAAGAEVEQVVLYNNLDISTLDESIREGLDAEQIDWVTVTSSAIARSLVDLLGSHMKKVKIASISPITTATLKSLNFIPDVEATEYTMQGLVSAIERAVSGLRE